MYQKQQYIVVKDRQPRFSEVLNDCSSNLCVPASKGEPLSSVLQKICAKIDGIESVTNNVTNVTYNTYIEEGDNITITGTGTELDPYIISAPDAAAATGNWSITGNANTTSANFLGTTVLQPLIFKVNSIQAGYITAMPGATSQSSGTVTLGQFAGQDLGFNNGANTLIGHGAGAKLVYNPAKANQNTFIGLWAGYWTKGNSDPFGGRNVLVGQSAAFRNYDGSSLTYVGTFAGEMNYRGNSNTGIGRDALRSNVDGNYNTALGGLASLYSTTGIKTIAVSNGGSGYTTATVTISAPPGPTPGVAWGVATATAIINAGQIVGITVTNPGAGYSILTGGDWYPALPTVTITGDGTGATATVTATDSAIGNTSLGFAAGYLNRFGKYNIEAGYLTSLNTYGDYNILLGYGAGAGTTAPSTGLISAIAIGKNSRVSANNTMALGGTGVDAINVGINTETARKKLDVVGGDILVHELTVGRGAGSIATNTVLGTDTMLANTTGFAGVYIGYEAGKLGTITGANIVIGYRASYNNNYAGTGNIIIGYEAAYLKHANEAIAIGIRAMYTQGSNGSVAIGNYALYNNVHNGFSARQWNTAIGDYSFYNYGGAGLSQTNTGYGAYSGYGMTGGTYNTAIGALTMAKGWSGVGTAGSTGDHNTALGHAALYYINNSTGNIGIGFGAFNGATFAPTVGYNIAIGYNAGTHITTGNYNVILGGTSGVNYATLSNHMIFADGQGNERFHINNTGDMILHAIQEHADNAAAVTAGLVVGTIYRTGDDLKIVH